VADKTRTLRGDKPAKTVVKLDKGGKGIHPLSGLYYWLALWGKLAPTNKNVFAHPHAGENLVFTFPNTEQKIRINPERDYVKALEVLEKYGPENDVPEEIIKQAQDYVEHYDFHKESGQ